MKIGTTGVFTKTIKIKLNELYRIKCQIMFYKINFSIILDEICKFLINGSAVNFISYLIDCVKAPEVGTNNIIPKAQRSKAQQSVKAQHKMCNLIFFTF